MATCYYCGCGGAKHALLRPTGRVWAFCDDCWTTRQSEEECNQRVTGKTLTEQAWAGEL